MIWLLGGYMWLFIHRPFEYWPSLGPLQIERGYMLLTMLFWLVWPGKGWTPSRTHFALGLFTVALVGCWWFSPYPAEGSLVVEQYFKVLVFYVLVVTSARDEKSIRLLVYCFLASIAVYMAHSLLEYTNGRYEFRQDIPRMLAVSVTYGDPNSFALTLLLAMPLTLPFWHVSKSQYAKPAIVGFISLASLCIILTGSRTSFIGLGAFGFLVAWRSRYRAAALVGLGAVGAGLLVVMPGYLHDRFLTLVDPSYGPQIAQDSAKGRFQGFLIGMEYWAANPITGVGPGAYSKATGTGFQAHNVYGQVGAELGTLGVIGFLGLLACFFFSWWKVRKFVQARPEFADAFSVRLTQALFIAVLLMMLTGWASHSLYRYNWVWFAGFQACALHALRLRAIAPLPKQQVTRSRQPAVQPLGLYRGGIA